MTHTRVPPRAVQAMSAYVYGYQRTPYSRDRRRVSRDDGPGVDGWQTACREIVRANPGATPAERTEVLRQVAIFGSQVAADALIADWPPPVPFRMPPRFRSMFTDAEWRQHLSDLA